MKTTAKTDIVNYLLGLFATLVLLVAWPRGKKGGPQKWTKITAQDMADPAYLQKLAEGNIGVIMGPASGGIGSLDLDDDQFAEEFLTLNPDLRETLRTRGARGCNIWFYPDGQVPASCKLMREGQSVGEWRWEGNQTIIWGVHPSGVLYNFQNATQAIRYPFQKIQFPPGVTAKFIHPSGDSIITEPQNTEELIYRPQSVALCAPLCPSVLSEGNGVLDEQTLETLLAGTIPTQRPFTVGAKHGNHKDFVKPLQGEEFFKSILPRASPRAIMFRAFSPSIRWLSVIIPTINVAEAAERIQDYETMGLWDKKRTEVRGDRVRATRSEPNLGLALRRLALLDRGLSQSAARRSGSRQGRFCERVPAIRAVASGIRA